MRPLLLFATLVLGACASAPSSKPPPSEAAQESQIDEPLAIVTDSVDTAAPEVAQPPSPLAPIRLALACGLDGTDLVDTNSLFDLTPTAWMPLARRLLACSPEAIAALDLGTADSTGGPAAEIYQRRVASRRRVLVIAYDSDGVVGVSVGEEVPERLSETVFELRSVQTQEAAGGEPVPSPPGTLTFPATVDRPFGVRLVSTPPLLVLSLVRE